MKCESLLSEGMDARPNDELTRLLAYPDMRVRQGAQFALAAREKPGCAATTETGPPKRIADPVVVTGQGALKGLARVAAATSGDLLARLHAIWGLGQVGRIQLDGRRLSTWDVLGPLLQDREAEVRAQAAKVLGEVREAKAFDGLIARLRDDSPRVRSLAAIALGKLGRAEAVAALLGMLRTDGDKDAYLRHAAVMGLVGSASRDPSALKSAADDPSPSARMGVLLAMRRLGDPEIARYLKDADPLLVLEAARAINDVPIDGAQPALAAVPMTSASPLPLLHRVLNAHLRRGHAEDAAALVNAASRSDLPAPVRVQALEMLGSWASPPGRDAVMGLWRPIAPRPAAPAADALRQKFAAMLSGSPDAVRAAAIEAVAGLGLKEAGADLARLAADRDQSDWTRAEAPEGARHLKGIPAGPTPPAAPRRSPGRARGPRPCGSSPTLTRPPRSRWCSSGSTAAARPTARARSPPWLKCAAMRPARRSSACSTSSSPARSPPRSSST